MRKTFLKEVACPECGGTMTIKPTYQTAGAITGATIACLRLLYKVRISRSLLALGATAFIPVVNSVAVGTLGGILIWTMTGFELGRHFDEEIVGKYRCQRCGFTALLHFLKKTCPVE